MLWFGLKQRLGFLSRFDNLLALFIVKMVLL